MANLNKTVVIQLADAGVCDIVTDFDVRNEHYSTGCPTCGSADFDRAIAKAKVISTLGEVDVVFLDEQYFDIDEKMKQLMPTQADLMRLLLNADTLQMLKSKTLQEFTWWLRTELYNIYDVKENERWGASK